MKKEFTRGRLKVRQFDTRAELGAQAAADAAHYIARLLENRDEVNIIFASAPSQNEFLSDLCSYDIAWQRVNAFHMDEYVGISERAPQAFGQFLRDRIFSTKRFKSTNYLNPNAADPDAECARYSALLRKYPADMVFLGIGENGHLAFNDPHVAFFDDPQVVKIIDLDSTCRQQQVNDGCFEHIEQVPTHAYTISIPELIMPSKLFVIVPAKSKANAVKATCDGAITTLCPASILRTHRDCTLYIDADSGSLL